MPVGVNNRFLLLYGSQTGQAKAIAEEIAEKADSYGLNADLHCFSETEKKFFIEREKCVVIVTSTTGDGEPPDTALKFFRRIRKKTLPEEYLSHLNYALLGLGDSNYTNFCNCGKTLDRRLEELGAKRFYEAGWADDAVGLEIVVEPWMENLFPAVKKHLGLVQNMENRDSTLDILTVEKVECTQPSLNTSQSNGDNVDTVSNNGETTPAVSSVEKVKSSDNTTHNNSNSISSVSNNVDSENQLTDKQTGSSEQNMVVTSVVNESDSLNRNQSNRSEYIQQTSTVTNPSDNKSNLNTNSSNANGNITTEIDQLVSGFQSTVSVSGELTESEGPSLLKSLPPLCDTALTVPILPPAYLKIEFLTDKTMNTDSLPLQNGESFPSAKSPVVMSTVISASTLTSPGAVKHAMQVTLDLTNTELKYQPGDSFSLVVPNSEVEVNMLMKRLGLLHQADKVYQLSILEDTKKKHASVPRHIPESATLRHTLMTCMDIREPPKKALIRALVDYTDDGSEKHRLQELCSKQGTSDYTKYIREPGLSILDILHTFKSCHPPIEKILEHSPRLQPRPYSVCSSPLVSTNSLSFVFNVVNVPVGNGRSYSRKGVATGWLESIQSLQQIMGRLKINHEIKVPIFTRTNQSFHLPDDVTTPMILIGPGTGIAPFIGFLDERAAQRQAGNQDKFGDILVLFGCRHRDRDFLFREKLEGHVTSGVVTKLLVSFSRDIDQSEGSPHYVQDNIRSHGTELMNLLDNKGAIVYVCGDAKNMAKDVNDAFIDIVSKGKGISLDDGRKHMMKLRLEKRYREDVWT